ncbi:delta-1-pyrroline-5-carboxylate synthase-like [Cicer arietinum]|uniref:delta-1-pyrroline-5-carboxylate synthase-like n=1 Tax=Cicer arietinum TaxID=3827 RepID=UPI003CC5744C
MTDTWRLTDPWRHMEADRFMRSAIKHLKLNKGSFYSITFSAARTCAQEEKLNVSVVPTTEKRDYGIIPIQSMYGSNGWESFACGFKADYEQGEIVIHNSGVEDDPACGPLIDSVALKVLNPPRRTREGPYVFPNASWGVLIPPHIEDAHGPLPRWIVESLKAVKYIDSNHFYVPEGNRAIELVAGKESSMTVEAFAGGDTIQVPYESKGKGGFVRGKLRFNGYATDNIIRVLQGEKMGTVFHKDAHLWKNIKQESAHEMAVAARNSSRRLQIAALAIQSGNGLLLKGGKEGRRSNAALHKVITSVMPDIVGDKLIGLVTSRNEIPDLLKLDDVIDLVVPKGSNRLVSQIKESTRIPVLDGICHVYVDKSANIDMAKQINREAKTDYPATCNAMETLLVHKNLSCNGGLNELILELQREGVQMYGGPKASVMLNIVETSSFYHKYSSLTCTIEIVEDVFTAIDHIHKHGRAITECIVTDDSEVAETFIYQVDSAAAFHNANALAWGRG